MTLLDDRPSTATGPTLLSSARAARGPLLAAAALTVLAVVLALLSLDGPGGRLDPASYGPGGSRAVAQVLRDAGVPVTRVETVEAVEDAAGPGTIVVVPVPQALAPQELERLAEVPGSLLAVGADDDELLEALGAPAEVRDDVPVEQRQPACDLPAARAAGLADLGGTTYRAAPGTASTGCYAVGGDAALLQLTDERVTLLGDGTLLTNGRLAENGNAALALGLLAGAGGPDGRADQVLWLVPQPGRVVEGEQPTLGELLPPGLLLGVVQLAIALAVLALWRARRLGRVVEEPLPVVVRAAEAVEGRSRLYRAAGARGSAAEALRAATRDRLARRVRLPTGSDRAGLVQVVAERTGDATTDLDGLLYGGSPADDAALVRLAADLRALEAAVAGDDTGTGTPPA